MVDDKANDDGHQTNDGRSSNKRWLATQQRMVDDKAKGGWSSGKRRMAKKQLHHVPMRPNEAALRRGAVLLVLCSG